MQFYPVVFAGSATISLFSIDDQEMLQSKFGDWWEVRTATGTRQQLSRCSDDIELRRKIFLIFGKK